ncbi:recombinase family protein [uncultured Xanthomonas sp.]|uniref:recombinase family protein n=1 Tax=uncultured Xanthomonas sp. TaxID=152831 RepID=UPI0025D38D9F|nr:recombinase family protein [uncultured Xanthomonas sp.]
MNKCAHVVVNKGCPSSAHIREILKDREVTKHVHIDSPPGRHRELSRQRGLLNALNELGPGDLLVMWTFEQLRLQVGDILILLEELRCRGCHVLALQEGFDTRNGETYETTVQKMAQVARQQRLTTRQRILHGMSTAKREGRPPGRMPALSQAERLEAMALLQKRGQTLELVAARYGVHPRTMLRYLHCLKSRDGERTQSAVA